MKKTLATAVFVVMAVVSRAQMTMEPPKELDVCKWMNGKWSGTMHWSMDGQEADTKMDMETDIEGQFVRSRTVIDMMGMKMTEMSLLGYDAKAKAYKCYTFTNWAPTPRMETVVFEGDKSVWSCDGWDGGDGKITVSRSTTTKVSDTEMKFLLEFKEGEKWNRVAEGTLKKQ